MNKYIISIVILILSFNYSFAQNCEEYDRNLFHWLPEDFPDEINCKDSLERKQGWWIHYEVQYNPYNKPDELAKGNYVEGYRYGMYKDNIKIGEWLLIFNVHLISVSRKDSYYYSKDTILITTEIGYGTDKSTVYYNSDSTIIKSTRILHKEKFPTCIECDKRRVKDKECVMTYRDVVIKEFPFNFFDFEFDGFNGYARDKMIIDGQLD